MKILKVCAVLVVLSALAAMPAIAGKPGVKIDSVVAIGSTVSSFSAYGNFTTDSLVADTIDLGALRASWYQICCPSCTSLDTVKFSDAQSGTPQYAAWLIKGVTGYSNPPLTYATSKPIRYLYIKANGRYPINVIAKN